MSGPYQSERERCLARSQFSSPDARREQAPAQRPDRAGATQEAVAASPSGHSSAHRTAGPRSVRHGSGPGIAWAPSLLPCALAAGHPVMYPAGPASRTPVAVPMRPWCLWCSCAWVCCGCGPGGWPLGRSSPRSHLAWQCCSRWPGQPGWGSSPIPAGLWAWLHITRLPKLAAGAGTGHLPIGGTGRAAGMRDRWARNPAGDAAGGIAGVVGQRPGLGHAFGRVGEAGVLCRGLGPWARARRLGRKVASAGQARLAGAAFHALTGAGMEHPLTLVDAAGRALTGAGLAGDIEHGPALTYVMAGSASRRPARDGVRPGLSWPRGFLAADVRHLHFLLRACCE